MRSSPLVFALLALAGEAHAWCRTTTMPAQPDPFRCPAAGVPVSWQGSCVGIQVDTRLVPARPEPIDAETFRATLANAADTWNGAVCPGSGLAPSFRVVLLPEESDQATGYFPAGANSNVLRFVSEWRRDSFHPPDAAAVTIVTFGSTSARIFDADTEFNLRTEANPEGFTFSVTGSSTAADLPTIVTHEMGHLIGLAHSAERTSVMWFSAGRGEQRRRLTDDDRTGLCTAYPPARPAECDPRVRAVSFTGGGLTCAAPPSSGDRRADLYGVALALAVVARRRLSARR